ncbi:thiocillin family RiPP [Streptomyces sp. NPDC057579]|uniref:thiocillin family RiPP n=1 Tax=Streptomyces sp. NPDC057579 TaxID=3346172 RepID=UPI0036A0BE93
MNDLVQVDLFAEDLGSLEVEQLNETVLLGTWTSTSSVGTVGSTVSTTGTASTTS